MPEAAEKAKAEAESAAKNTPAPTPPATSANPHNTPPPSAAHDAQIKRLPSGVLDTARLLRVANEATIINDDGH